LPTTEEREGESGSYKVFQTPKNLIWSKASSIAVSGPTVRLAQNEASCEKVQGLVTVRTTAGGLESRPRQKGALAWPGHFFCRTELASTLEELFHDAFGRKDAEEGPWTLFAFLAAAGWATLAEALFARRPIQTLAVPDLAVLQEVQDAQVDATGGGLVERRFTRLVVKPTQLVSSSKPVGSRLTA